VRNRFPPPISVKQLEDVLQEEWYKIPLETVQNLYKVIPRTDAILKAKVTQHHIIIEMCIVSVVFPLFCPTPVLKLLLNVVTTGTEALILGIKFLYACVKEVCHL
jgi:hypothetical protein